VKQQDEYTQRIALASPAQLVVITYELLIGHLMDAKDAIGTEGFTDALAKARACVNELSAALNLELSLSAELLQLYIYINKLLIRAQMENSTECVEEALKIAVHLLAGWRDIEAAPDVQNRDKGMYAGLTYTKNGVLSEYEPDGAERGYRV